MTVKHKSVTDAELAILKILWERGPLTARVIREKLYPACTHSDHATVQKLLQRLERKGCTTRDRSGFAHVFRAGLSQEALVGQQLEALAEKLTDGSLAPLIMHAVASQKLSPRERREIRDLLRRHR